MNMYEEVLFLQIL